MRGVLLAVVLACVPVAGVAQQQTLADIRQELSVLFVEVQRLKRELSTTGSPSVSVGGASALERVGAIEAELQRLTSQTEQLEFRVGQVVRDGTNRIGDLEFRLCELETKCDIGSLSETSTLGGGSVTAPAATPTQPNLPATTGGAELAFAEQDDFDRAKALLEAQKFDAAAEQFEIYAQTYPGGPLVPQAQYLRGVALEGQGQTSAAARAFLESFSGSPNGSIAPNALLRLGIALGDLGQSSEACVTLGEVSARFPGGQPAIDAEATRRTMGCS